MLDEVWLDCGDHTRHVVFDRGESLAAVDGRDVIVEGIPVSGDGTILTAVDPLVDRTQVTSLRGRRVLYVGSVVRDGGGCVGTITRTVPVPLPVAWA